MSDLVWILLIAAAYFLIIRPMFQGAANVQSKKEQSKQGSATGGRPHSQPNAEDKYKNGDFVDYEDIK